MSISRSDGELTWTVTLELPLISAPGFRPAVRVPDFTDMSSRPTRLSGASTMTADLGA